MTYKVDLPKKKPNHFYVYNKKEKKYDDIKYISQNTIAEGYIQVMPKFSPKKLINHFSVTLAYLPDHLWYKLKPNHKKDETDDTYKTIKDKITKYSIVETNQDSIMINLYKEIHRKYPDPILVEKYINELDESLYSSWLVIRSNYFLKYGIAIEKNYINKFEEITNAALFV